LHPAQKQAILAMLASIQQQILQVQGLLGYETAQSDPVAPRDTPRAPAETQYLSDDEEKIVEKELEQARQIGLEHADVIAKAWKRQQAELSGTGVAF
jgi:hypothetical protein